MKPMFRSFKKTSNSSDSKGDPSFQTSSELGSRGQVWIETVLYTLIGISLMGMVLAFALPKINSAQDNIAIEQSIDSLRELDNLIRDMLNQGAGNRRTYEIQFSAGELEIDAATNKIKFEIKGLKELYSEEGVVLERGPIEVVSSVGQKGNDILLELDYSSIIDITYSEENDVRRFGGASTAYKFSITHGGIVDGNAVFNFEEVSGRS